MPLTIKKLGYYTVFEPEAVCVEEAAKNEKEESAKRIRIAMRNIGGLLYMRQLLNVFNYGIFSLELFSHKILRLLIPVFLISLFITDVLLAKHSVAYTLFLLAQLIFYITAIFGYFLQERLKKRVRLLYVPMFFCVTNFSILVGIFKFLLLTIFSIFIANISRVYADFAKDNYLWLEFKDEVKNSDGSLTQPLAINYGDPPYIEDGASGPDNVMTPISQGVFKLEPALY